MCMKRSMHMVFSQSTGSDATGFTLFCLKSTQLWSDTFEQLYFDSWNSRYHSAWTARFSLNHPRALASSSSYSCPSFADHLWETQWVQHPTQRATSKAPKYGNMAMVKMENRKKFKMNLYWRWTFSISHYLRYYIANLSRIHSRLRLTGHDPMQRQVEMHP